MPTSRDDEEGVVTNASDRKQLKAAQKMSKEQQKQWEKDMVEVLGTPAGRRVLYAILKQCKTFETIWHPSALIHYQSGQQDIGHWLMAEINDLSPESLLAMLQANRRTRET